MCATIPRTAVAATPHTACQPASAGSNHSVPQMRPVRQNDASAADVSPPYSEPCPPMLPGIQFQAPVQTRALPAVLFVPPCKKRVAFHSTTYTFCSQIPLKYKLILFVLKFFETYPPTSHAPPVDR